jgi:hypothetical protein
MIILGFLAVTLILAIAAARFGVDSRFGAWRGDFGYQWDPTAQ